MNTKIPGGHGEGYGTGLPHDVDYADIELRVLAFLQSSGPATPSPVAGPVIHNNTN